MVEKREVDFVIKTKTATYLLETKTTTSGIRGEFAKGRLLLFYHSYNPNNSFLAVPPELLLNLARKAGAVRLANGLERAIEETKGAKEKIIERIREKTRQRLAKKEN